jgi:hypothetical protein
VSQPTSAAASAAAAAPAAAAPPPTSTSAAIYPRCGLPGCDYITTRPPAKRNGKGQPASAACAYAEGCAATSPWARCIATQLAKHQQSCHPREAADFLRHLETVDADGARRAQLGEGSYYTKGLCSLLRSCSCPQHTDSTAGVAATVLTQLHFLHHTTQLAQGAA